MTSSAISCWLICIATLINAYSGDPVLCNASYPLDTPYFTSLLDTPRKARGCSSLAADPNARFYERLDASERPAPETRDVHVVSLHAVGGKTSPSAVVGLDVKQPVKLNVVVKPRRVNETRADVVDRMVLVLHADRPVKWVLRMDLDEPDEEDDDVYLATNPTIVISEGSEVEANFNMNVSHQKWANKNALHRYVKKTFKGIASYSEVKGANHLELTVGSPSKGFAHCDMTSQQDSAVLTASLNVQLTTEGCFNEAYIGDTAMDVYVVELEGSGTGRNRRVGPDSLLPVMVQLLGEGTRPVPRNVTVVLKSHQPIKWQVGARRIHGNIVVVVSDVDDQVENSSSNGHETLDVRTQRLPNNVDQLLLSVLTTYGQPILYAKTKHASTLRLVVGARNRSGVRSGAEQSAEDVVSEVRRSEPRPRSGKDEMQQQPNTPEAVIVTSFKTQDLRSDAVARLKAAMVLTCGKTVINMSFPTQLLAALGSPRLTLRDPACTAAYNATHATLSSHVSSCGSTSDNDGRFTLFSNNVNVKFQPSASDDEDDVEGSGTGGATVESAHDGKIPVVCKYTPHFPGDKFPTPDDGNPDEASHTSLASLYRMEVFRDRQHKTWIDFNSRDVPEVQLGEVLYIKAFLDSVMPIQVVTEECWISNSSDHRVPPHATLIRNTCPVDLSTKILPDANGALPDGVLPNGMFNFQVNKGYESVPLVYLHCRLGLCAAKQPRQEGNLRLCVDPGHYCSGRTLRPYLDRAVSVAQQFAHRGPFRPVATRRQLPTPQVKQNGPPEVVSVTAANSGGENGERIVYLGVSTEVAVCIAIASFIIGVGLTGALWCIHIRTDPFRQRNKQAAPPTQAAGGTAAGGQAAHGSCFSANTAAVAVTA